MDEVPVLSKYPKPPFPLEAERATSESSMITYIVDEDSAKRNPPLASVCWVVAVDFPDKVRVEVAEV